MAQTSINIRIDEELKKEFNQFCENVGLSMSAAFCVFARACIRHHRIPFAITELDENGFTPKEAAELLQRVKDIKNGKYAVHDLIDEDD